MIAAVVAVQRNQTIGGVMSASTTITPSTRVYATPLFSTPLWRTSGIRFVGLFIIAYFIYDYQPQVGAWADAIVALYQADRTRILIAAMLGALFLVLACILHRRLRKSRARIATERLREGRRRVIQRVRSAGNRRQYSNPSCPLIGVGGAAPKLSSNLMGKFEWI